MLGLNFPETDRVMCIPPTSVGSKPKLGSAWLGFGSSFWEKKLGSAWLAMPSKKLGSARLAISCKKKLGSAWLALSFKKLNYL